MRQLILPAANLSLKSQTLLFKTKIARYFSKEDSSLSRHCLFTLNKTTVSNAAPLQVQAPVSQSKEL